MFKSRIKAVAVLLALLAPVGARGAVLGPDAAACAPGASGSAVLVRVDGFKNRAGKLRVQLYGSNPADFLAKGKKVKRIQMPVTRAGAMAVCVAVPQPGNYAIAVRHDTGGNGSDWNDGGGFSRNPSLSLISLKPRFESVVIPVGPGVRTISVVLNYRQGLSIRPIAG